MIETNRLIIYAASEEQMRSFISAQSEDILKAAYSEMLNGSLMHPEQWEWYAIWMIELKNGTHIGELCFKGVSEEGNTEIGYGISDEYQGHGYASEAVSALSAWALDSPGIACVTAEVEQSNIASRRVLEKAGFTATGESGAEGMIFARKKPARATKEKLVSAAYKNALIPFHGYVDGKESNLEPIISLFPRWSVRDADCAWCAAFVYFCLREAGFDIPYSPDECITCSLAGCGGFEEFALADDRIEYRKAGDGFRPDIGDIVIFDNVFSGKEHDHIGIIVGFEKDGLLAAEGNIPGTNTSGIVRRRIDGHIRCYIRIPEGYSYISD